MVRMSHTLKRKRARISEKENSSIIAKVIRDDARIECAVARKLSNVPIRQSHQDLRTRGILPIRRLISAATRGALFALFPAELRRIAAAAKLRKFERIQRARIFGQREG